MKLQPEKRASSSCQAPAIEEDEIEKVENLKNGGSVSQYVTVGALACFRMSQTLKFHPHGKTTWLNLELTSGMLQTLVCAENKHASDIYPVKDLE